MKSLVYRYANRENQTVCSLFEATMMDWKAFRGLNEKNRWFLILIIIFINIESCRKKQSITYRWGFGVHNSTRRRWESCCLLQVAGGGAQNDWYRIYHVSLHCFSNIATQYYAILIWKENSFRKLRISKKVSILFLTQNHKSCIRWLLSVRMENILWIKNLLLLLDWILLYQQKTAITAEKYCREIGMVHQ